MKSKYILSSALSLAIVGASIVSPFSYAWDKPTASEGIDYLVNKAYWGSNPKPKDTTGYVSVIEIDVYNSDYSDLDSIEYFLINSPDGYSSSYSNCWRISYGKSGGHSTYYNRGKFSYVQVNVPNDFWAFYRDNTLVADIGILCARYRGNYRVYSNSSRININFQNSPISQELSGQFIDSYGLVSEVAPQIAYDIDNPPQPPTTEPYTDSAPGFPNLPDNWVNGGGDIDIKIDLPDVDFNLPELPEYTLPDEPTIPEQFKTNINTILGKCWDFIVQSGLTWLVILSLTCSLIIFIFSR